MQLYEYHTNRTDTTAVDGSNAEGDYSASPQKKRPLSLAIAKQVTTTATSDKGKDSKMSLLLKDLLMVRMCVCMLL